MRITLICGLPASGKTTYGQELARKLADTTTVAFIDDPDTLQNLPEINQVDVLIISDPFFCLERTRNKSIEILTEKYNCEMTWIFFENDPIRCHINSKRREEKKCHGFIDYLSNLYTIPAGAKILPVWCEKSVDIP